VPPRRREEEQMASDVEIPGDDLQRAQDTLTFVRDFINLDRNEFDFTAALGAELAGGAAQRFESAWDDGRVQLGREMEGTQDAITAVLDAFAQTDDEAASSLDQ
jgi:hypothetical protein